MTYYLSITLKFRCRKGLYCGTAQKNSPFVGEQVCKRQRDRGQECIKDKHCNEGLLCLPEIFNERGKKPRGFSRYFLFN